eukprot:g11616.t1
MADQNSELGSGENLSDLQKLLRMSPEAFDQLDGAAAAGAAADQLSQSVAPDGSAPEADSVLPPAAATGGAAGATGSSTGPTTRAPPPNRSFDGPLGPMRPHQGYEMARPSVGRHLVDAGWLAHDKGSGGSPTALADQTAFHEQLRYTDHEHVYKMSRIKPIAPHPETGALPRFLDHTKTHTNKRSPSPPGGEGNKEGFLRSSYNQANSESPQRRFVGGSPTSKAQRQSRYDPLRMDKPGVEGVGREDKRHVKDINFSRNVDGDSLGYHGSLRSYGHDRGKSMTTVEPGRYTYVPGKGKVPVAEHRRAPLHGSHEHPHNLVRERSRPGKPLHTRPMSPANAKNTRPSAGTREQFLFEGEGTGSMMSDRLSAQPRGSSNHSGFYGGEAGADQQRGAPRGAGGAGIAGLIYASATVDGGLSLESELDYSRSPTRRGEHGQWVHDSLPRDRVPRPKNHYKEMVPTKAEVNQWCENLGNMTMGEIEKIIRDLATKLHVLSKCEGAAGAIIWQACADLRLLGYLSDRTKRKLLSLETTEKQLDAAFVSADLAKGTEEVEVFDDDLDTLKAELAITRMELAELKDGVADVAATADVKTEEQELQKNQKKNTAGAAVGAPGGLFSFSSSSVSRSGRSKSPFFIPSTTTSTSSRGIAVHDSGTSNLSKVNEDLENQLRYLKFREHSLDNPIAIASVTDSDFSSALAFTTAAGVASRGATASETGPLGHLEAQVRQLKAKCTKPQMVHLSLLLERFPNVTSKAQLATILNDVDAFDLQALRSLQKPDAMAKLTLQKFVKALSPEAVDTLRRIVLGATPVVMASSSSGPAREQGQSVVGGGPAPRGAGLAPVLIESKQQLQQLVLQNTTAATQQAGNNFAVRQELTSKLLEKEELTDAQAGFLRHLLQPGPDSKLQLRKYLNELDNKAVPLLYKVFLGLEVGWNNEDKTNQESEDAQTAELMNSETLLAEEKILGEGDETTEGGYVEKEIRDSGAMAEPFVSEGGDEGRTSSGGEEAVRMSGGAVPAEGAGEVAPDQGGDQGVSETPLGKKLSGLQMRPSLNARRRGSGVKEGEGSVTGGAGIAGEGDAVDGTDVIIGAGGLPVIEDPFKPH